MTDGMQYVTSLEQQPGSGSWLAATTVDGEQQLKMQWGVPIDL
jgi:hypothetical protein